MSRHDDICVAPDVGLNKLLQVLETSVHGICVVVDEQRKILGTITDGDCRRAILRKNSINVKASEIMNTRFIVVDETFYLDQIQALMQSNGIEQVPIVDAKGVLKDIVSLASLHKQPEHRPNDVLILAGGQGQRLRPLTSIMPKPMLPVGGQPILERIILQLVKSRFAKINIAVNHMRQQIEGYFGNGEKWGCAVRYLHEERPLGTAGPLKLLPGGFTEPVLVVNGDLVTTVNFGAMVDFHQKNKFDFTLGITESSIDIPYGVVSADAAGLVTAIAEKPTHTFTVSAGVYVLEPQDLSLIPEGEAYLMTEFIDSLIHNKKRVGVFPIHEHWLDIGQPDQYMKAQLLNLG